MGLAWMTANQMECSIWFIKPALGLVGPKTMMAEGFLLELIPICATCWKVWKVTLTILALPSYAR